MTPVPPTLAGKVPADGVPEEKDIAPVAPDISAPNPPYSPATTLATSPSVLNPA